MVNGHSVANQTGRQQSPGPLAGPANAGRRQRRAVETRLRLFRCALQLFAERGFHNVTVEEITEAADVGKGTFFNHFETKDHLLSVLAEIQLGNVRDALAHARQGKQTTRTVLHRLALGLSEEPGRSPSLARALISSFLASEGVRTLVREFMQQGCDMVAEIVGIGQKCGEIDSRLKHRKVALQFQQSFLGTILFWSLHGEPPLAAFVEESFQHFWRSIAASAKE